MTKLIVPAEQGGKELALPSVMKDTGVNVPTNLVGSYPLSTYTVYITGSSPYSLASLFDSVGNPASNPGTTDSTGLAQFYVNAGTYDVTFSGTGIDTPFTLGAITVS